MIEFKSALKNGDLEKLRLKLDGGIDPNDRDGEYKYPIQKAAAAGDISVVKLLLEYFADINIKEPLQGNTAINLAIFNKNLEMVKFLIENEAKINIKNSWNMTSLEYAKYLRDEMKFSDMDIIIDCLVKYEK